MKAIFRLPFIILTIMVLGACDYSGSASAQGGDINVTEAREMVSEEDVLILDVRTPEEYANGHLKDAVNIDIYDPEFQKKLAELPKEQPVLVYCHSGGRSAKAASQMSEMGFEQVYNMEGGYREWSKE